MSKSNVHHCECAATGNQPVYGINDKNDKELRCQRCNSLVLLQNKASYINRKFQNLAGTVPQPLPPQCAVSTVAQEHLPVLDAAISAAMASASHSSTNAADAFVLPMHHHHSLYPVLSEPLHTAPASFAHTADVNMAEECAPIITSPQVSAAYSHALATQDSSLLSVLPTENQKPHRSSSYTASPATTHNTHLQGSSATLAAAEKPALSIDVSQELHSSDGGLAHTAHHHWNITCCGCITKLLPPEVRAVVEATIKSREKPVKGSKRKKGNPNEWKQNIRKKCRELGKEYTRKDGSTKPQQKLGEACKCSGKGRYCAEFTEEERQQIFDHVWSISWEEKRVYAYGLVDQVPVKRRTKSDNTRRQITLQYFLKKDGTRMGVCSKMFLNTTRFTNHFIRSLFEKGEDSKKDEEDRKVKGVPPHVLRKSKLHSRRQNPYYERGSTAHKMLDQFISELPKMPGEMSSKMYLEQRFKSIADVHKCYAQFCTSRGVAAFKLTTFRHLFNTKNLCLSK